MNSKENVIRSLEFKTPERIPLIFPSCGFTDVTNLQLRWDKNWNPELPKFDFINSREPGKFADEWDCVWTVNGMGDMGQVTGHPLEDFSKVEEYKFPDPYAPGRFQEIENSKNNDKYILFWMPLTLFERLYMLHGFDKTLMDFYLDQKNIEKLLNIILDFNLKIIEQIGEKKLNINGIGITDDWGTGQSTFISVELWKKFFKKKYEKIINLAHSYGFHVWMHSDGKINDFIPEFINIGLDAINMPSTKIVGIKEIGDKFNGKICFFNGVDNQTTLLNGDEKEIEDEARCVIENWGSKRGGIIIYFDDDNWDAIGINDERKYMVFNIFQRLSTYYS